MKTYYHNTGVQNPNNITFGYLTDDGDFVTAVERAEIEEFDKKYPSEFVEQYICKVVVESGLLYAGTLQDYYKILQKAAKDFLKNGGAC